MKCCPLPASLFACMNLQKLLGQEFVADNPKTAEVWEDAFCRFV
jgi:hypothetical protein